MSAGTFGPPRGITGDWPIMEDPCRCVCHLSVGNYPVCIHCSPALRETLRSALDEVEDRP